MYVNDFQLGGFDIGDGTDFLRAWPAICAKSFFGKLFFKAEGIRPCHLMLKDKTDPNLNSTTSHNPNHNSNKP